MPLWEQLTEPFLQGTADDPGGLRARAFLADLEGLMDRRGVERSAPVIIRVAEVLSAMLIVRRLEDAIAEVGILPDESDPLEPAAKPRKANKASHDLLETLAKWQERQRKAMKDLEDTCTRSGTPIDAGLADTMKPILRQAEGVLDDALAFARRDQRPG